MLKTVLLVIHLVNVSIHSTLPLSGRQEINNADRKLMKACPL
jgi:hypothetical protein